jgi:hypothetical protein
MKKTINAVAVAVVAAAALAIPVGASASVLTFDDLAGSAFFGSAYHGFNFGTDNTQTTAWFYTDASGTTYQPHSGASYVGTDYSLYSGAQLEPTQAITSATSFIFNGAWFSGGDSIEYALYDGAQLVYTSAAPAQLTATSQYVASGYAGLVTGVVILGKQGYYAMDDFTYNEAAPASAVPEPGNLALALAGLMAMFATLGRRKR